MGGSAPDGMSEYYAGGGNTPSGCEGDGGLVPSSGTLQISDFYGACQVAPAPSTTLVCTGRSSDYIHGIYPYPCYAYGWSYFCLDTQNPVGTFMPGYGSYTGDPGLDGGGINEAFYAVQYLQEPVAISQSGLVLIMWDDTYWNYGYRVDYEIRTPASTLWSQGTLFSSDADSDGINHDVRYDTNCFRIKSARSIYWSLGLQGPGGAPTNLEITVHITRTSP